MIEDIELEGSINKWEDIVSGKGADKGVFNCPLCSLYHRFNCIGCPVREVNKVGYCKDTPFTEWIKHQVMCHRKQVSYRGRRVYCPTCLKLAQKELDYLKSLR